MKVLPKAKRQIELLVRDPLLACLVGVIFLANNICRLLGLNGRPADIIAGLASPEEQEMNLWQVTTPHGPDYFIDAMGIGVFADILENYRPDEGKSWCAEFRLCERF